MSMISAQVDELRELATRCDELQVGVVKAVTMPSDMGSILRDAADTILSLRDKAQELQAENAKLRERIHKLEMEGSDHFYRMAYAEDANRTLEAENARLRSELESVGIAAYLYGRSDLNADNAKLRELVRAFDWCTENFDTPNKCDRCPLPQSDALEPECEVRMRELRVEVDG